MHTNGPGLTVVGDPRRKWYGGGYCGICGHTGEGLIPVAVRWWDPDDGWKRGVLCEGCGEDASERGPHPEDYAYVEALGQDEPKRDVIAEDDEDAWLTCD